MEKEVRVFLACAFGIMAGLVVAWFVPEIVWWLGALVGGSVSGFLYALPEIKRYAAPAARLAWRPLRYTSTVCRKVSSFRKASALTKWKVTAIGMFVILVINLFLWIMILLQLIDNAWVLLLAFIFLLSHIAYAEVYTFIPIFNYRLADEEVLKKLKKSVLINSPIGLLFTGALIVIAVIKSAPRAAEVALDILRFLAGFAKNLYIFVHSRELILCVVDGGLGVVVFYFLCVKMLALPLGPTLLMGGLIGGLLGILDYELISKRVLHLAPNKSNRPTQ